MGGSSLLAGGSQSLLSIRVRSRPTQKQCTTVAAAKLPYGQGDTSPRKNSMQTQATNPAVSASAMVQPDLLSERQHLEKLYSFNSMLQAEATVMEHSTDQALQDVDALLQDLHSLDAELEFALESVKEDFSELTVSLIINLTPLCTPIDRALSLS